MKLETKQPGPPDPIVCNQCGAIGKPYANCNGRCDAVFTHKIDAVPRLSTGVPTDSGLGLIFNFWSTK